MELIQAIVTPLLRHASETEIYSLVLELSSGTRGKKACWFGDGALIRGSAERRPTMKSWRGRIGGARLHRAARPS